MESAEADFVADLWCEVNMYHIMMRITIFQYIC